jgi:hypothetical protein
MKAKRTIFSCDSIDSRTSCIAADSCTWCLSLASPALLHHSFLLNCPRMMDVAGQVALNLPWSHCCLLSPVPVQAGGWLGRVYMLDFGTASIDRFVTLGSPHNPPPAGAAGVVDQTRGILTFCQDACPGAFHDEVGEGEWLGQRGKAVWWTSRRKSAGRCREHMRWCMDTGATGGWMSTGGFHKLVGVAHHCVPALQRPGPLRHH